MSKKELVGCNHCFRYIDSTDNLELAKVNYSIHNIDDAADLGFQKLRVKVLDGIYTASSFDYQNKKYIRLDKQTDKRYDVLQDKLYSYGYSTKGDKAYYNKIDREIHTIDSNLNHYYTFNYIQDISNCDIESSGRTVRLLPTKVSSFPMLALFNNNCNSVVYFSDKDIYLGIKSSLKIEHHCTYSSFSDALEFAYEVLADPRIYYRAAPAFYEMQQKLIEMRKKPDKKIFKIKLQNKVDITSGLPCNVKLHYAYNHTLASLAHLNKLFGIHDVYRGFTKLGNKEKKTDNIISRLKDIIEPYIGPILKDFRETELSNPYCVLSYRLNYDSPYLRTPTISSSQKLLDNRFIKTRDKLVHSKKKSKATDAQIIELGRIITFTVFYLYNKKFIVSDKIDSSLPERDLNKCLYSALFHTLGNAYYLTTVDHKFLDYYYVS